MSLTRCPFCEQNNPADAKFCNECGGALYLAPCPSCGAVNQLSAIACYQCRTPLQGRGTAEPVTSLPTDLVLESSPIPILSESLPVAVVSEPRARRAPKIIIGTAVVVVIAGLGYNTYRQRALVEEPQPRGAINQAVARDASGDAGGRGAATAAAGAGVAGATPSGAAVLPTGKPPTHGVLDPSRDSARQPAEPQKARAATAVVARPQPASAGKAGEQRTRQPEACAAGVTALGLCGAGVAQTNEAQKAGPAEIAQARPQAADAGKAARPESPRPETCTEAAAALGLCPADIPQRR